MAEILILHALLRFGASFCASLLGLVPLLIPIAAAQKFRIPRIADIFAQASEPRSWINDRADFFQRCDITSRGLFCAGAREVPCSASRRSKSIEECDFWRFRVVKMRFFCSEHRKFMKMNRGKLGTPQIDPRGSDGAGILAIRSYRVGYEAQKLHILMLNKTRGARSSVQLCCKIQAQWRVNSASRSQ